MDPAASVESDGPREPLAWIARWSHLVPQSAALLDVACGSGRHVRWFASRGCRVTAIDRDEAAVTPLRGIAEVVVADIERNPWPLAGRRFDAVVVTNYLWRPLLPVLIESLGEGGVLLYQTFADGHASVGRPANADFLLRPAELLKAAAGLRVVAFEEGFLDAPARFVQRIAAVRRSDAGEPPHRYPLEAQSQGRNDAAGQVKSVDSEEPA